MTVDESEIQAGVGEGERGPGVGAVAAALHGLIFLGQDAADVTEPAFRQPRGNGLVPPLVMLDAGERGDPRGEPNRAAARAELRPRVDRP